MTFDHPSGVPTPRRSRGHGESCSRRVPRRAALRVDPRHAIATTLNGQLVSGMDAITHPVDIHQGARCSPAVGGQPASSSSRGDPRWAQSVRTARRPTRGIVSSGAEVGEVMVLLQIMFGALGVLARLPRRLLLGLVLFVLGLVLLELVHPSPRSVQQHAPAARQRTPPPPGTRESRNGRVTLPARSSAEPTSPGVTKGGR